MSNEQKDQQQKQQAEQTQRSGQPAPAGSQPGADQAGQAQQSAQPDPHPDFDALANKKPEELTPEELRLMADTMPGEGPGD
ncbi:hypothetical protein AB595_11760 [Massilia sp. WF1]|uniref:hypothetical protein n=1 Tax=unclassified Massilia TaxID=2609279 RepID=UPI00064AB6A9|nr:MULTISPECIES: hypothetical protein [unclassified Massilia]ALK97290.1 hypothetical protein AM586_14645 [Massilia sp. WG5]KLU36470.1 hypothetical protein AB595_11760 [Massilia sp. WF1]